MLTTENIAADVNAPTALVLGGSPATSAPRFVTLVDGSHCNLQSLSATELLQLQADQEPAFAKLINASSKGSDERCALIRQAYETVCEILDELSSREVDGQALSMGMDSRYTRLVLEVLGRQRAAGIDGGFFELGFGSGIMLEAAASAGYRVGGLEVASQLFDDAKSKLASEHHQNLWLGDFCATEFAEQNESYCLVYWNDVFEHIPGDEISDYLATIYNLLQPGGKLITITPNWHMRPSDVTSNFAPPRSTAVGFHLKEYTLGEVRQLLFQAGFTRVETPTYISRKVIHFSETLDITSLKSTAEPLLEMLPYKLAVQCCRRFGLNCTVATKGM